MVAKERANAAEKRFEEESKAYLAEITAYNNLINAKASIYNRLAETANIFLAIFNPNGIITKAARIRRRHSYSGSPFLMTYWRAV